MKTTETKNYLPASDYRELQSKKTGILSVVITESWNSGTDKTGALYLQDESNAEGSTKQEMAKGWTEQ